MSEETTKAFLERDRERTYVRVLELAPPERRFRKGTEGEAKMKYCRREKKTRFVIGGHGQPLREASGALCDVRNKHFRNIREISIVYECTKGLSISFVYILPHTSTSTSTIEHKPIT